MGLLLILIPLVFFLFLPWIFSLILKAAGIRSYADFPQPLKWAFGIVWGFFNIMGVLLVLSMISGFDGLAGVMKDYEVLNYMVMLLFYPLLLSLWHYIKADDRHPAAIFFGFVSLLACCALFLLAIVTELFRGASMKIGG